MTMAVSEYDYYKYKEYWDYQRKVEFNREKVFYMAERFDGRIVTDFGGVGLRDLQEMMWSKIKPKDYDDPPAGYIPENPDYRLWYETGQPQLEWKKKLDDDYDLQEPQ